MLRIQSLVVFLVLALGAGSCASAAPVSEPRPASAVTRIEVRIPIDLSVHQGDAEGLVLTGEPDQLKHVRTVMQGGTLVIDEADQSWHSRHSVKGVVTVKALTALTLTGAGSVDIGPLKTGRLELSLSGAGNLQLTDLNVDELSIAISGTGHVTGTGSAGTLDVHIAGVGDIALEQFQAANARVAISGSGTVKVAAKDHLDATISGVGEIKYLAAAQA